MLVASLNNLWRWDLCQAFNCTPSSIVRDMAIADGARHRRSAIVRNEHYVARLRDIFSRSGGVMHPYAAVDRLEQFPHLLKYVVSGAGIFAKCPFNLAHRLAIPPQIPQLFLLLRRQS